MARFLKVPYQPIINLDLVTMFDLEEVDENHRPILSFLFVDGDKLRFQVDEKVGKEIINSIISHEGNLVLNHDGTVKI